MGTSDVVLVSTSSYNPHPEYHAFFHPAQNAPPIQQSGNASSTGQFQYFNMLVYKSAYFSLTLERLIDIQTVH